MGCRLGRGLNKYSRNEAEYIKEDNDGTVQNDVTYDVVVERMLM